MKEIIVLEIKKFFIKEKKYILLALLCGSILSLVIALNWSRGYSELIQGGISKKVVRFHVLANSDTKEDQALKLKVRDRILEEYRQDLEASKSKDETLEILKSKQFEICKTAQEEVIKNGYSYAVAVSIIREDFPLKQYDELVFPPGVYDALRIEIGEAEGKNWWCVLYPNMCFVDAAVGYSSEDSYEKLKNNLTNEEFLVISSMEQKKISPKIKFKIVEFWQSVS